jgi:phospholipid/cholesterol/gamma-HCH transport system substrate-binding protein
MEPEAKYTLVGTVVLILIALIAAAVVWLRSTGEEFDDRSYKLYFERQSLEGLQPRSKLRMKDPHRLGHRLSHLNLAPWRGRSAGRVDGSAPVRQSTRAVVRRHLVTGIASILLINLTEDSPPLTEVPQGGCIR